MNFKILCRSFEAPTQPYQIKQTESKSAKKWQRRSKFKHFESVWTDGQTNTLWHTHTHTHGARFIVPSRTSFGGDNYDFLWQLRNCLQKLHNNNITKSRVGGIFRGIFRVTPIQFFFALCMGYREREREREFIIKLLIFLSHALWWTS